MQGSINKTTAFVAIVAVTAAAIATMIWATGSARAEFGIKAFDQQATTEAGGAYTQAGGHPYSITTAIDLNTKSSEGYEVPDGDPKDIIAELPPGMLGNPTAVPECTDAQLVAINNQGSQATNPLRPPECPIDSQVGTIQVRTFLFAPIPASWIIPVYNMVPPPGDPAKFGFLILGLPITMVGNVRNGGDFGVDVVSSNMPIALPLNGVTLTLWGNPADRSHDAQRCDLGGVGFFEPSTPVCPGASGEPMGPHSFTSAPIPFLALPVSCTAPGSGLRVNLRADSWEQPGVFAEQSIFSHLPPGWPEPPSAWGAQVGTTGCDVVPFRPSIAVEPTNQQADTPSGLSIDIALPQDGLLNPTGIATADVKDAVVTLPEGESVSPSAADGLEGCSQAQIGLHSGAPADCPDASKLGTVEIQTPLLSDPLKGAIFLGAPECAPCAEADDLAGRLLKLYIVVEGHGVRLKLAGRVELDPHTGRIKATFSDNPQLPFDRLKLDFKAGPRSPLVNPPYCGTYATDALLTPWSGNAPVRTTSSFEITSGPGGGPCPPSPQQLTPGFTAGTVSNQAGGFSPFSVTLTRADGQQQLGGVAMTLPSGLLGSLAAVPLCGEPQAALGTCTAGSQIGSLTVAAGAGANPFYVEGGKVFLTGPYNGAPFGLSVVVPAKAGPFDLGTVVVRGTIRVDPHTAALTVATEALPTILDGIPLDLRSVNVSIDRPQFIFNPTDCQPLAITGTVTGGLGATIPVSSHFQAANCGNLHFQPSFKVSTSGKTSRKNGANLHFLLTYPNSPQGTQANIKSVHVELPKALPSRLSTLNHACVDSVFNQNPANCPSESRVGSAKAVTPVLPVPLEGPAYFVSHGGQKFPELIVVLQGDGVTVDLQGETFISKAGITSSTFKSVPDVPVGSFELTLPQKEYSALAANTNLCTASLTMPIVVDAQDGAALSQSTPIEVEGCPYRLLVVGRRVDKRNLVLKVSVPVAGKLVASGKGVSRAAKSAKGRQTLTLALKESRAGRLRTKITLGFTPKGATGKQRGKAARTLHKSLTVTFR